MSKETPPPGETFQGNKNVPTANHQSSVVAEKIASMIVRHSWKWLLGSIAVCLVLTAVVVLAGDVNVTTGTEGWKSRGTLIADRQIQTEIVKTYKNDLFHDEYIRHPPQEEASPWDFMVNNIVLDNHPIPLSSSNSTTRRHLGDANSTCGSSYYFSGDYIFDNNLIAMWGGIADDKDSKVSILDPENLLAICEAEMNTNQVLEDEGLCVDKCGDDGGCIPPFSFIYFLRVYLGVGFDASCSDLIDAYTPLQEIITAGLMDCANDIRDNFDPVTRSFENIGLCPLGFGLSLVDTDFGVDGNKVLRYTSSYFVTAKGEEKLSRQERKAQWNKLYKIRDNFDLGDSVHITGTYDTSDNDFNEKFSLDIVVKDAVYASLAALVTFLAMIVHTKSLWISSLGLAQVLFAVSVSFFVYNFVLGIEFFPVLNLIGLFVSAALGTDDLFVAADKWKNCRLKYPEGTSEDIAKIALPDAAGAMFLTTSTTGVAFFATCICPVPPIFTFAVFCGLMIVFNYVLNCLLVFPALCIYDRWLMNGHSNCFVSFSRREREEKQDKSEAQEEKQDTELQAMDSTKLDQSLIHRILSGFYNFLHTYRWVVLTICAIVFGASAYVASTLSRPQSSEVRLLPHNDPLEQHYQWSRNLLSYDLFFADGGVNVRVFWGLTPSDKGDHIDPHTLSNLALDEDFDPSSIEAQTYLLEFCDRLFENDFAERRSDDFMCEINKFDDWLRNQTAAEVQDEGYLDSCAGADSLPMAEDKFHDCIVHWSKLHVAKNILSKDGIVKIIRLDFSAPTMQYDDPISTFEDEWNNIEAFFQNEATEAPRGVNQMFHGSWVWWWYDTNSQMMYTAYGAAGITIGFSVLIVLLASKSFILTLISGLCISYVLVASTATLVLLDWKLGFLESVCFAILIGISCDFVIHFGHAYSHLPGIRSREERTKHSLIHMGPSVLASAATSICGALLMFFCHLRFFTQFAEMLVLTMIHAIIGSFVVYTVFTDMIGPSQPSKSLDVLFSKCRQ